MRVLQINGANLAINPDYSTYSQSNIHKPHCNHKVQQRSAIFPAVLSSENNLLFTARQMVSLQQGKSPATTHGMFSSDKSHERSRERSPEVGVPNFQDVIRQHDQQELSPCTDIGTINLVTSLVSNNKTCDRLLSSNHVDSSLSIGHRYSHQGCRSCDLVIITFLLSPDAGTVSCNWPSRHQQKSFAIGMSLPIPHLNQTRSIAKQTINECC